MSFLKFSKFLGTVFSFLFFASSLALCMESTSSHDDKRRLLEEISKGVKTMELQRSTLEQQVATIRDKLKNIESSKDGNLKDEKGRLEYDMKTRSAMLCHIETSLLKFKVGPVTVQEFGNMSTEEASEVVSNLSIEDMNKAVCDMVQTTVMSRLIAGLAEK